MKRTMLVAAGILTVGGMSWLAWAAGENQTPSAKGVAAPAQCRGAVACTQDANCHVPQADCDARCKGCPEAKDQDGDGRCDAVKACTQHATACVTARQPAACHTDGAACRGTDCGDCRDSRDADGNGTCDKTTDCGRHARSACPGHGADGVGRRAGCHAAPIPTEDTK